MSNIKYINFFGSSFTEGGGFEFDKNPVLKKMYQNIKINEISREKISIPGQIQELLGDKIRVNNYAKCGAGNDRMMRCFYDIIEDENFSKDENLFIFEYTYLGRKEYYHKKLEKYLIANYTETKEERHFNPSKWNCGWVVEHYYENESEKNIYKIDENKLKNFLYRTYDKNNEGERHMFNALFFLSFLKKFKFNFIISSAPIFVHPKLQQHINLEENIINYKFPNCSSDKSSEYFSDVDFAGLSHKCGLNIYDETDYKVCDMHPGYFSKKITTAFLFNKMIEQKFIIGYNFVKTNYTQKDFLNLKELLKS